MYPNIVAISCNHFFSGNSRERFAFLPHFLLKGTIFGGKKIIGDKMCVDHFYRFLCKTLDSKKNSARYCHTFTYKVPVIVIKF